jgi:hypothetical protein
MKAKSGGGLSGFSQAFFQRISQQRLLVAHMGKEMPS